MEPAKVINIVWEVIIISTLLLASFIVLIIYFRHRRNEHVRETILKEKEYQRSLFQSQIEVQEATFSSVGKELHDNIGQLLSSTKMLLGVVKRNLSDVPEAFTVAESTIGNAIIEVRLLSKSLDKQWLNQFNLIENLQAEVRRINAGKIHTVHFSHPDKLLLSSEDQVILFRIIQEAIQNAVKHSGASNISINIISSSILKIDICDDGSGFKETFENKKGMGLMNMRHRTKLLGGSIQWNLFECEGTSVTIELPLKIISE